MRDPLRGEIWIVDFGEPIGHEAGSARPGLVMSDDPANVHGLVVLCPVTRTRRAYPTHIELEPGGSGLQATSYVQAEQVRTVSTQRLSRRLGTADPAALAQVERSLRFLLRL